MRVKVVNSDIRIGFEKGLVIGEADVDKPSFFFDGFLDERRDKIFVVMDGINLPHHIVA